MTFEAFLTAACKNMLAICKGSLHLHEFQRAGYAAKRLPQCGRKWSTFIIWAKNTFTLGRSDYQRQYEPILYGWKDGNDRYWCGARDQGDVWFYNKPQKNDLHPTMKPVDLGGLKIPAKHWILCSIRLAVLAQHDCCRTYRATGAID